MRWGGLKRRGGVLFMFLKIYVVYIYFPFALNEIFIAALISLSGGRFWGFKETKPPQNLAYSVTKRIITPHTHPHFIELRGVGAGGVS